MSHTPNGKDGEIIVSTQGAVRTIAINRPSSKNGLTIETNRQLIAAFEEAGSDPAVRSVLLMGTQGNFCSGLDLRAAMALVQEQGLSANEDRMRTYFHGLIRSIRRVDKPVVAYIDGPAVGFGCDLALSCDIRLGSKGARLGQVFVKRGLMPDGGGTYTMARLCGVGRAMELMMTGDVIDAVEAERIGLLNRIVDGEADAMALAQRLAEGPPLVMRHIKRAVYGALSGTLDQALEAEVAGQMELLGSQDFVEGISAFFMKRPPVFSGK